MDLNRFTEKAQEALAGSQQLAVRLGHQQVDVEHPGSLGFAFSAV